MTRWIETDDGTWINLAHAVSIRPLPERKGRYPLSIAMAGEEGRTHTATQHCDMDSLAMGALLTPVIPAQPGQEAVVVWAHAASEDHKARPDTTTLQRVQVIGWRLEGTSPPFAVVPILPGDWAAGDHTAIAVVLSDGKVYQQFDSGICTLDEFVSEKLEHAQKAWDRAHAAKAAAE